MQPGLRIIADALGKHRFELAPFVRTEAAVGAGQAAALRATSTALPLAGGAEAIASRTPRTILLYCSVVVVLLAPPMITSCLASSKVMRWPVCIAAIVMQSATEWL